MILLCDHSIRRRRCLGEEANEHRCALTLHSKVRARSCPEPRRGRGRQEAEGPLFGLWLYYGTFPLFKRRNFVVGLKIHISAAAGARAHGGPRCDVVCYVPLIQMGITKRRTRHSASSPFPGAVHEYTKLRLVASHGDDLSCASPHGLFVGRSVGCLAIHPSPLNRSLNAKYAHARPSGRGTFFAPPSPSSHRLLCIPLVPPG